MRHVKAFLGENLEYVKNTLWIVYHPASGLASANSGGEMDGTNYGRHLD